MTIFEPQEIVEIVGGEKGRVELYDPITGWYWVVAPYTHKGDGAWYSPYELEKLV
jgi:hypothetical protein